MSKSKSYSASTCTHRVHTQVHIQTIKIKMRVYFCKICTTTNKYYKNKKKNSPQVGGSIYVENIGCD